MRRVQLFEEFVQTQDESSIIETVYNDLLVDGLLEAEGDTDQTDPDYSPELGRVLTGGEKAAVSRGFALMTDAQLAGAYLRGLGVTEENPDKFMDSIEDPDGKHNIVDFSEVNGRWTNIGLADAMGMASAVTFGRASVKFANLINGIGETPGESLSPKIIKAYDNLSKMDVNQVGLLAGEALQDKAFSKNRDAAAASANKRSIAKDDTMKRQRVMAMNALMFARALRKKNMNHRTAKEKAVERIAQTNNVSIDIVSKALDKYMKDNDEKLL